MLESTIESCAVDYAEKRGWWHRKVVYLGRRGAPDHIFARGGVVIFVEFKKFGKTPNRAQGKEHDRLRRAGVLVYVIDNLADGYALFDSYGPA